MVEKEVEYALTAGFCCSTKKMASELEI